MNELETAIDIEAQWLMMGQPTMLPSTEDRGYRCQTIDANGLASVTPFIKNGIHYAHDAKNQCPNCVGKDEFGRPMLDWKPTQRPLHMREAYALAMQRGKDWSFQAPNCPAKPLDWTP